MTDNRQLLDAFTQFQWDRLSEELQFQLIATVFNQKTISDFLSSLPDKPLDEQQGEKCQHPFGELIHYHDEQIICQECNSVLPDIGKRI